MTIVSKDTPSQSSGAMGATRTEGLNESPPTSSMMAEHNSGLPYNLQTFPLMGTTLAQYISLLEARKWFSSIHFLHSHSYIYSDNLTNLSIEGVSYHPELLPLWTFAGQQVNQWVGWVQRTLSTLAPFVGSQNTTILTVFKGWKDESSRLIDSLPKQQTSLGMELRVWPGIPAIEGILSPPPTPQPCKLGGKHDNIPLNIA